MRKFVLTFLTVIAISCSKGTDITGVWYNFDSECVYHEIHVNKEKITTCNNATGGCGFIYNYRIIKDSIFLYYKKKLINTGSFELVNDSTLYLNFDGNNTIYNKVKESSQDYFLIKDDDEVKIDSFLYEFQLRSQNKRVNEIKCK